MNATLRLQALVIRRAPWRVLALALLTAVATVVFILVSDLSRVSTLGLEQAIANDSGTAGSYTVFISPDLSLTVDEESQIVAELARSLNLRTDGYFEVTPPIRSECPPYEELGEQSLRILWEVPGKPASLPFGEHDGIETEWCLGGQSIPDSALFVPSVSERERYGNALYLDARYRDLVRLGTTGDIARGFRLVTVGEPTSQAVISEHVNTALHDMAVRSGFDPDSSAYALRNDREVASTRAAQAGIATVYDVIRWGVVLLAGMAVVTVQTLAARQRGWYYGLARALGASRRRVIVAISFDTSVTILVAALAAFLLLFAAQDPISTFARGAFQVEAAPLDGSNLIAAAIALFLIAVVGGIAPAMLILNRDPLAVLEAPRD